MQEEQIKTKVVADSISTNGSRITTFELQFHRFLLPEFNTHRMFSRNAASSRAIPVNTQLDLIRNHPAMPLHWGKNQPGMQAKEECNNLFEVDVPVFDDYHVPLVDSRGAPVLKKVKKTREEMWKNAANAMIEYAHRFSEAKYHKQIVNRLVEPFVHIKVVVTATSYNNFFYLRCHEDAQPEIHLLSRLMYDEMVHSVPRELNKGEWHVPYYEGSFGNGVWKSGCKNTLQEALAISASCSAQVSYRKNDASLEKAQNIYDKLINSKPAHASPTEHQATPIVQDGNANISFSPDTWEEGITAVRKNGKLLSGNFEGWIQHRQLIPEHEFQDEFRL